MRVIDVLVGMAEDLLPEEFKFRIRGDGLIYYIERDGFLYYELAGGRKIFVEWSIFKDWLTKEIEIVNGGEE